MRIKIYSFSILFFLFCSALTSFSQSGVYGNNVLTERPNTPINDMINGFIEVLPVSYASNPSARYPVLIFLEGQSQFGNGTPAALQSLYGQNEGMLPDIIRNNLFPNSYTVGGTTYEFIVLIPQLRRQVQTGRPSAEQMASPAEVNDIINYALQNYRVDQRRVYLSGLSLGGGSTWNYAGQSTTNANRLAAIVPFAGASALSDNQLRDDNIAAANLPVWTFVNSEDATYRPLAEQYITAINANPAHTEEALITIYTRPSGDHNSWQQPLSGGTTNPPSGQPTNIFEWMLTKSRPSIVQPVFATISAGADQTINLATGSMVLNANSISFTGATATLTGTATPASGRTITSTTWVRVDGNGSTITSPNSLSTTVTNLKPGINTYQLRVTDDQGLVTVDNVVITVNAPADNRYVKVEAENFTAVNAGPAPMVDQTFIDEGPAYGVGFFEPGRYVEYSLTLPAGGTYALYYRYISPFGNPGLQVIVDGVTYTETLVSDNTWRTDSVQVVANANTTIRFVSQGSGWNFNYFELARTSGVLPVRYVYFNASCQGSGVGLQWKTATEQDSRNFSVQRSTDGSSWSEIGTVAAAGQSTEERTYNFTDRNAASSAYLYRIVQYDYSGRTTISSIVRSNCATNAVTVSLYPNPSAEQSTLSLTLDRAQKVSIRVVDSKGAIVRQSSVELPAGTTNVPLYVSNYAKGIYTVDVQYGSERKSLQLIKN